MTEPVFPSNFLWGTATSAYQIEGAADLDGRGPSIWDVFCRVPGKIARGESGDVACDHYRRCAEDVSLMRDIGLRAYRFSISWPRVMPTGRDRVNAKGLDFYDRLVDRLCDAGIEPVATLYHWDLPAALQFELGGWLHDDLPKIFADYGRVMFDALGDRVRYWLTINEPWCVVDGGYFAGVHAPGARNEQWGYLVGHNLIRAHAHAVAAYRAGAKPGGAISFAMNLGYSYPENESNGDGAAAERAMVAMGGWFADPMHFGDYPPMMRERLGDLLPAFSREEASLLRGSMDYIALNYYHSDIVRHSPASGRFELERADYPDVPRTEMGWAIVPDGLRRALHWVADRYPSLPVYVTENGAACNDHVGADGEIDDQNRIAYLHDHLAAASDALRDGVDLRGYFVWSLLDNFEWSCGYDKRFGLIRCDFPTGKRTIKASGRWYARFIESGSFKEPQDGHTAAVRRSV